MINDHTQLHPSAPYCGTGIVTIDDGTNLFITHTGITSLTNCHNTLVLDNVLCVPNMQKNLLSVSQFTKVNKVHFEFHPSCCYVKGLKTHQIIFQGPEVNGLYQLQAAPTFGCQVSSNCVDFFTAICNVSASSSETSTFDIWHMRFGHPSSDVLTRCLNYCNVSLAKNKTSSLYHACALGKSHKLPFQLSQTTYT